MERKEERASERNAALLWTSILWSFLKTAIWTWPQKALSYCELRLKPHPLIQFYFSNIALSVLWVLTCTAVHKQNGFQLSFHHIGLDLNKMCFAFACAGVCVCALCECTQCRISPVKTAVIFEYPEYAKLPGWMRGARQNVSLGALTCFTHGDHTNKLYDLFVFFYFLFHFGLYKLLFLSI